MSTYIIADYAREMLEESRFFTEPDCPFQGSHHAGDARLAVVVGENASGKSLLYRMVAQGLQAEHKVLAITISIRERTGSGQSDMSGMRRMFMFGDETPSSTGAISAKVVESGFKNLDRPEACALLLDEPELGLSDGYARALGEFIGLRAKVQPPASRGVLVVTHSRALVEGLVAGLEETPTFVCMGSDHCGLQPWLHASEMRSLADLSALAFTASDRRKQTQVILNRIRDAPE